MKSILEHLRAELNKQSINEAKTILSNFVPYKRSKDNGIETIDSIEGYLEDLKVLDPNDLKKIGDWKGFDKDKLTDYCRVVELVAAYVLDLCDMARDEDDPAYYGDIKISVETMLDGEGWYGYESVCDGLDASEELKTAKDYDSVCDYVKDVLGHMNEISKTFLKMNWA